MALDSTARVIPVAAARSILARTGRAGPFSFDGAFVFGADDARAIRSRLEQLIAELAPCPKCAHGAVGGHYGRVCGGRFSSGASCRCTFDQRAR